MARKTKKALAAIGVAVLALLATGCGSKDVNSGFDSLACIYDGSKNGGEKLKRRVPPGVHIKTSGDDIVVRIPTSNRFYAASEDRGVADPGAPEHYLGFTRGNARVNVQGQIRFRFNQARACQWYAKHGRRNAQGGELGFNVRTAGEDAPPWGTWLNENFGVTMKDVISSVTNSFTWPSLVYNYPSNANPDTGILGKKKKAEEPERLVYGRELGRIFTERLNANLGEGGPYFCGIESSDTGDECPPMFFQVFDVKTVDPELMDDREKIEKSSQQLANAEADAAARARTQKTALYAERLKARILPIQLRNALTQARIDNAKCIVYAQVGLDCEGHRPNPIVGGAGG